MPCSGGGAPRLAGRRSSRRAGAGVPSVPRFPSAPSLARRAPLVAGAEQRGCGSVVGRTISVPHPRRWTALPTRDAWGAGGGWGGWGGRVVRGAARWRGASSSMRTRWWPRSRRAGSAGRSWTSTTENPQRVDCPVPRLTRRVHPGAACAAHTEQLPDSYARCPASRVTAWSRSGKVCHLGACGETGGEYRWSFGEKEFQSLRTGRGVTVRRRAGPRAGGHKVASATDKRDTSQTRPAELEVMPSSWCG
jgi:hypothetical protein